MPEALELLKTRRSVKPLELAGPGPAGKELDTLLTVASRVPDHGKLTPWRFIVFDGDARLAAGAAIEQAFGERRADEAGGAGDQCSHENSVRTRSGSRHGLPLRPSVAWTVMPVASVAASDGRTTW